MADASKQLVADRYVAAQLELTRTLAEANTLVEAAERLTGPVWRMLGFDAGIM